MVKTINTKPNEILNDISYFKEELNAFMELGYFQMNIINSKNYIFSVKWGYTKQLYNLGYNRKTILKYLNLIEFGLNNGLICDKCLKVGIFGTDETNAFISKCKEHGSLI